MENISKDRLEKLKALRSMANADHWDGHTKLEFISLIDSEIARQSVTDEVVKASIETIENMAGENGDFFESILPQLKTALTALRSFRKPTAEEVEELDRAIEELKRLRIALATARCDGMRIIDMLSPAIEILTALRRMKGSESNA